MFVYTSDLQQINHITDRQLKYVASNIKTEEDVIFCEFFISYDTIKVVYTCDNDTGLHPRGFLLSI